ncbi:autotransporter assembly complex family protein [Thioclava sp. GXIMD4216]|uniref:Autotransporter assembly complex family protein n=1 Tax=Thioclava litoralis TaxID=3076557 RepID=A0ABZ1DW20_9RHOB|nr:autotransporter assembly complex family protein [Thioclava sp. FTW29]
MAQFQVSGGDKDLTETLKSASLVVSAEAKTGEDAPDAQDLFGSARADYARLLGALYDEGYYAPSISILVNGKEAASIAPLDAPATISSIQITVDPGPKFTFSQAQVAPLAPKTELPDGFRAGQTARTSVIRSAAQTAVDGWEAAGHAKADVASQKITADHRNETLATDIRLDPGPKVTFGDLTISGYKRMREERIRAIAGFPKGQVFDPDELELVRTRLRRASVFSSITMTEADKLNADDSLDYTLGVVEEKRRRLGAGVEYQTVDGLTLSGYWLHRNLFGGAERLRVDAEVSGIGGSDGGADYSLGVRMDRPATFSADTSAYAETTLARESTDDYDENSFEIGGGLTHYFNEQITGELGLAYRWSMVTDDVGDTYFSEIAAPGTLTLDKRNSETDATKGYYAKIGLRPFVGLNSATGTGIQTTGDLRGYFGFGADDRFVLAGRAQYGAVLGASLAETPRDYLFYSGGGGTVRGQPYQSLGVEKLENGTLKTGGTEFMGFSGEFRAGITESIGAVAFYDMGWVGDDGTGDWQSGAGIGLRYKTGIGPIRLDVAAPVDGDTGEGVQLYVGLGQAF